MTIKDRINKLLDQQNAKGLAEYGISLDDVDVNSYDWKNEMIMELIDALQYQTKEVIRLEKELKVANHELRWRGY